MSGENRVEAVLTGHPPVYQIACTRCGVLLWDIDAHYEHAHGDGDNER